MEKSQSNLSFSISMISSLRNINLETNQVQFACDLCNSIPKLTEITNKNKIIFKCPNKLHGQREILIDEYLNKIIKYNKNNYECEICDNKVQKYYPNNKFKYCYNCKKIICYECIKKHNNKHKIINNDEYNIKCNEHYNEKYEYYCIKCDKNLCLKCYNEHYDDPHKKLCLSLSKLKVKEDEIEYLKNKNKEYNEIIKNYMNLIKLNNIIINSYEKYKNNYYNIYNITNIIQMNKKLLKVIIQ